MRRIQRGRPRPSRECFSSSTGRISITPTRAGGKLAATAQASSMSLASMTKNPPLLLCLDKGADRSGDLAGADADRPGRPGPLQSVRGDVVAAPSDLLGVLDRGVDKSLHLLLGHRVQHVLVVVDREHELHRIVLTGEAP